VVEVRYGNALELQAACVEFGSVPRGVPLDQPGDGFEHDALYYKEDECVDECERVEGVEGAAQDKSAVGGVDEGNGDAEVAALGAVHGWLMQK